MGLFGWMEKNAKKMKWYDFSFLKLAAFFFTLFLVTAWTGFRELVLGFEWYWHLVLAVIFSVLVLWKMGSK